MSTELKKLSNPFSTGSGGASFENAIQAKFVTLMLTGGYAPCLPSWPITEIKLQGKVSGYHTDDVIVTVENPKNSHDKRRLLGQVKHSVHITNKSEIFAEVIQSAWSDFNNPSSFNKGKDVIALITGPLSKTDIDGVNFILEQARHTKDYSEFSRQVDQANFSSNNARKKRDVFRNQLYKANGSNVSDEDFFEFLRHFHLLAYDLDKKGSVISSLLQSHIAQFNKEVPYDIWCKIVCEVQGYNQTAGTITLDRLPENIKKHFERPVLNYLPNELASQVSLPKAPAQSTDWNSHQFAEKLAFANLIGSWNENSGADKKVVEKIVGEDYDTWIGKLRSTLATHDSPFLYKNGLWAIKNRKKLWADLGSRLFDDYLERFRDVTLNVLQIDDPSFDLPLDQRFIANIYDKTLPHSSNLRMGLAETLALLGNQSNLLPNCSFSKAENIVSTTIYGLFENSDWLRWGSLDGLLPTLAEANPNYFLQAVEKAISTNPSPFDTLFEQESTGAFGQNYLIGLLWALEGIAWDEEYLTRVSVVLSEIATHDPGGNWSNRPINSLIDIFLPWHPQTLASVKKRQVAIKAICNEQPEVGWNLLLNLLPNQHTHTSGTYKPKWRDIVADDWQPTVSSKEYWEQNRFCAELLVEMAEFDVSKLTILVGKFDQLVQPAFEALKDKLSSNQCLSLPEEQRLPIWNELIKFISRHRRYSDADWAIDESFLTSLDVIANDLGPQNAKLRSKRLFLENDLDLYENSNDWDIEQKKLFTKRKQAIQDILANDGLQGVLDFAWEIHETSEIGVILAKLDDSNYDSQLLPTFLDNTDEKKWKFIVSYIFIKNQQQGWRWFDELDISNWSKKEVALLLSIMPFEKTAWDKATQLLGKQENLYWKYTNAVALNTENNIDFAIAKLLEVERPQVALQIIRQHLYRKHEMNINLVCDVLLALAQSNNLQNIFSSYDVIETIKALQENPLADQTKLIQIEWAYLNLLDKHSKVSPITLENALATDPNFFCQIIQMVYTSKNQEQKQNSETSRFVARNAYQLLSNWKTVPGTTDNSNFDSVLFKQWLDKVEEATQVSGHYEVAMRHVGQVLIHSPSSDKLWIHPDIAKAMNARERTIIRDGYKSELYNSRGAHWVDPEAKPEMELASKYRKQADEVENEGYQRLATTLRDLATWYEDEAKRILDNGWFGL